MQKVVLAMVSARRQMKMYLDMARRGIEDFESSGRLRRDMRVYTGLSFRTPPPITSFDFSSTSRITRDLREDMASRSL